MMVTRLLVVQVRSVTLDTWLPDQVAFMERTGNAVANSFWEARLGQTRKPDHDAPELQAFIRRKVCVSPSAGTFL
jgi:stromal membrane-associated protein